MKKTIIFDLDGTLLYTIEDIRDCANKIFKKYGYKEISTKKTLACIGYGAKKLIKLATGETNENKINAMLEEYVPLQENCKNEKTTVYDGLDGLLKRLKKEGFTLAIVSNKPDEVTQVVVKQKLGEYGFDFVTGQIPDKFKPKPDKSVIEYCLKELNTDKKHAVYIGDSEVDVNTYKNAGIDGITVLWGYRDEETLLKEGAENLAKTPEKVYEIIKSM